MRAIKVGDSVTTTAAFKAQWGKMYDLSGVLIKVGIQTYPRATVASTGKPCQRTHVVELFEPFMGEYSILTFCPEDLEAL